MECCICYKNDAGIPVCSNNHTVCRGCLELFESTACPLCRETMVLPESMNQVIIKNQEKTRAINFLREILDNINRYILITIDTHNLPKSCLPDELCITLPENLTEDFMSIAMNEIFSQIKKFALDRDYSLKNRPYTVLKIIRGDYSLSEVLGLPMVS